MTVRGPGTGATRTRGTWINLGKGSDVKQQVNPVVAAIVIVVVVAIAAGVYFWRDQQRRDASAMKPPSMLPPQFSSMSTKDPVPPQSATQNQPIQGHTLAPPGLGSSGPAIQSGGMMPGTGGMAPTPGGMPPAPPGVR